MNAGKLSRAQLYLVAVLAVLVGTTNGFGLYLFSVLNFEMQPDLGFGQKYAGLAAGVAQGSLMLASFAFGVLTLRIGTMRWALVLFYAVSVAMLAGMGLNSAVLTIFPLMASAGVAGAVVWLGSVALVKHLIPPAHQGKALGIIAATGTSFFIFLNGIAVPVITESFDWRAVWLFAAGLSAVFLLIGTAKLLTVRTTSGEETVDQRSASTPKRRFRLNLVAVAICCLGVLNGLTFIPFMTFLNSYLQGEVGWAAADAGRVWSFIGLGAILGGIVFGYLSDWRCARDALFATYALALLTVIIALSFSSVLIVYAAVFLFGLAYAPVFGQSAAYISKTQTPEDSHFLNSMFYVAFGLGSMMGNAAVGYAAEATGSLFLPYTVIAAAMLATILLTASLSRDQAAPLEAAHE